MKTGIATALSVAGVVVAGAAAFAVNTAVLSADSSPPNTLIATPIANIANPTNTTVPPSGSTRGTAATSTTSTYKVGDAGRVILEVSNNSIRVASVLPAATWRAQAPEYDDGEVEVYFFKDSVKVEFTARLVNGQVKVFVESEDDSRDDSYEKEYDDRDDDDHDDDRDDDDDHDDDHEDDD